jgi:hypothetical protein
MNSKREIGGKLILGKLDDSMLTSGSKPPVEAIDGVDHPCTLKTA